MANEGLKKCDERLENRNEGLGNGNEQLENGYEGLDNVSSYFRKGQSPLRFRCVPDSYF